jgi:hypothetical protein
MFPRVINFGCKKVHILDRWKGNRCETNIASETCKEANSQEIKVEQVCNPKLYKGVNLLKWLKNNQTFVVYIIFLNSHGLVAKQLQNGGHNLERISVNGVHITCIYNWGTTTSIIQDLKHMALLINFSRHFIIFIGESRK